MIFLLKISKESSFPCLPTCPTQHGAGVKRDCVIFPPCIRACANFVNKTLSVSGFKSFSSYFVYSFTRLAGVHSKVRIRCSEVGTEWLKSWNLFLIFPNKNLWSRNSVLGLGQADKRKIRLVPSTGVFGAWQYTQYLRLLPLLVSEKSWEPRVLTTTFVKSFRINFLCYQ